MIEPNSQDEAEKISIACQTLTLNAGYAFDQGDDHALILPPERPLFDQVLMMRIYIEAATNLKWLLRYLHEDEFACYKLLERAYILTCAAEESQAQPSTRLGHRGARGHARHSRRDIPEQ